MNFFKRFQKLKVKEQTDKKRILSITLISIGIACLLIGSSMAYLLFEASGTTQTISAGTLQLSYTNESEAIILNNAVPQSDEQGLNNNVYSITLTNTSTIKSYYELSLNNNCTVGNSYTVNGSSVTANVCIPNNYIKVAVKTNKDEDYTIKNGGNIILKGYLEAKENISFEMIIWLTEETPNDYQGQTESGTPRNVIYNGNFKIYTRQMLGNDNFDLSGANKPVLASNMIPVYYDETEEVWKKADVNNNNSNYQWYSYESSGEYKGRWANAVTVKDTNRQTYLNATPGTIISMDDINTMWVWIPRFKVNTTDFTLIRGKDSGYCYESGEGPTTNTKEECEKLGPGIMWVSHYKNPGAIDVTFVKENDKAIDSFTFGDKELSGFWFAKFATSHSTLSSSTIDNNLGCTNETCSNANGIIIKPNVTSLRYNNISNFFYASRSMEQTGNSFGFVSSEVDTHMSKNNEWGTVAYLTHSIYGRCNNSTNCANVSRSPNEVYNTTSGKDTSTTGTIYGVYNMNNVKKEYVMGVLADTNGNPRSGYSSLQNSGFTGMLEDGTTYTGVPFSDSKYYNLYSGNYYEESAQIGSKYIGHALKETDSWYGERIGYMQSTPLSNMYPWVLRNWELGMFNVWHTSGYYYNSFADSSYSSARFVITNE